VVAECNSKKTLMKTYGDEEKSKKITIKPYLKEVLIANASVENLLNEDTFIRVLELKQQKSVKILFMDSIE